MVMMLVKVVMMIKILMVIMLIMKRGMKEDGTDKLIFFQRVFHF